MSFQNHYPTAECAEVPKGPERRAYVRHACRIETAGEPIDPRDTGWPALIRNISTGGVLLSLKLAFDPGVGLYIELPTQAKRHFRCIYAEVVHCVTDEQGAWLIGCQFSIPLSKRELNDILHNGT